VNEVYAINPRSLRMPVHEVRMILREFGLMQGRFIAAFPNNWMLDVLGNYEVGSKQHADLIWLIDRCRDAFLQTTHIFRYNKSWDANALEFQKRVKLFEEIFSEETRGDIKSIRMLIEQIDFELKDGREDFINVAASSYASVCTPLFACSEEVVLHDYLFTLRTERGYFDRDRVPVLESLLGEMVKTNRVRKFLILFNGPRFEDRLSRNIHDDLSHISKSHDPEGRIEVMYDFDSLEIKEASQHPRCVFSVKGGLQFDQGFQIFRTSPRNLVRWMSPITLRPFQEKYLRLFH